jgi:hypothetical protein
LYHLSNLAPIQPHYKKDDATSITLAANNNMGQLGAKGFLEFFSQIVHCNPSLGGINASQNGLDFRIGGQRFLFSELNWDGFISNLIFLDLMPETLAATAA